MQLNKQTKNAEKKSILETIFIQPKKIAPEIFNYFYQQESGF